MILIQILNYLLASVTMCYINKYLTYINSYKKTNCRELLVSLKLDLYLTLSLLFVNNIVMFLHYNVYCVIITLVLTIVSRFEFKNFYKIVEGYLNELS